MYKLFNTISSEGCVHRLLDNAYIPFDPDNTDFVEYQKWLDAGNTPLPADEPNA
jgi:hypothetical protein